MYNLYAVLYDLSMLCTVIPNAATVNEDEDREFQMTSKESPTEDEVLLKTII